MARGLPVTHSGGCGVTKKKKREGRHPLIKGGWFKLRSRRSSCSVGGAQQVPTHGWPDKHLHTMFRFFFSRDVYNYKIRACAQSCVLFFQALLQVNQFKEEKLHCVAFTEEAQL